MEKTSCVDGDFGYTTFCAHGYLRTSPTEPTTMSVATDTNEDSDIERDDSTLLYVAKPEGDNLWLRQRTDFLERELNHVNERFMDQRRQLQAAQQAGNRANVPNELYATAATGRTWHRNLQCHHLRGVRTRAMRPCADCERNF